MSPPGWRVNGEKGLLVDGFELIPTIYVSSVAHNVSFDVYLICQNTYSTC